MKRSEHNASLQASLLGRRPRSNNVRQGENGGVLRYSWGTADQWDGENQNPGLGLALTLLLVMLLVLE